MEDGREPRRPFTEEDCTAAAVGSLPLLSLERVMNFGQALLDPVAEGEVAVWKGLEHRWVLRAGCG
jgi:hypothetical protein